MTGLDYYLNAQRDFQRVVPGGVEDRDLTDPVTTMESVRVQMLGLQNELHEALGETGWKPWASSNHINDDRFRDELIDAFRFYLNLVIISGMSSADFHTRFNRSLQKSVKRVTHGYDGVSDKCPACKRAYDDTGVTCARSVDEPIGPAENVSWCEVYGHINATGNEVTFNGVRWVPKGEANAHPQSADLG